MLYQCAQKYPQPYKLMITHTLIVCVGHSLCVCYRKRMCITCVQLIFEQLFVALCWSLTFQSLEFVAETRILAEMKIENRRKKFCGKTNWQAYFFFFFLTVRRFSRKYGNHAMNECKFASKIECWWSYRSWTFAYFKLFPWRKYTADPDWSKKFVKPMNIDFAFEA